MEQRKSLNIYGSAKIVGYENIEFGNHIIIDDFAFIYARKKVTIGNYVHIAGYASITGGEEVKLEDFSCISWGARIFSASDDFTNFGFGNSTVPEKYRNLTMAPVKIGKFCIVGANSVILPGVNVGEGATIGANSVVSKDLAPWGVYINNKRIRERNREGVLKNYEHFIKSLKPLSE